VLAVREFRALFGTFVLSLVGDELARVALTVLVYLRTESPLLSAITFAISYLPWLLGGPILSAIADRLPRHRVLIATDAARAVLVAAIAIPRTPLPVLLALLFLVSLGAPPFESARSALVADVFEGDRYAVASSLSNITLQVCQVAGFLLAGGLVALSGPRSALLVDAATFLVSALWLSWRLHRRPAPSSPVAEEPTSLLREAVEGLRLIARTPRLRAIVGLLWAGTMFTFAPEGLAVPFARQLGQGATGVGVLLAANPLGVTVGAVIVGRVMSAERRERLMAPLVALSLLPLVAAGLVATSAGPGTAGFVAVLVLMFASGFGAAWAIPLNVSFVQAVPAAFRGRAFGVATTGLYGVQGLGIFAAGALAEAVSPGSVVAAAGALGMAAVVVPLLAFYRTGGSVAGGCPAAGPSRA
jgi:MFS family permease